MKGENAPMSHAFEKLDAMPRVRLGHAPTPLDDMANLTGDIGGARLLVKRDDCTGLCFGGNKVRQLEFYLGEAVANGCDTILITGAVQSNFVRSAAAAAAVNDMECHIQLEHRVARDDPAYKTSGNVLLDKLLGATLHHYDKGEDEAGADRALESIAEDLRAKGQNPYIIHLSPGHPPRGALGYMEAARELAGQCEERGVRPSHIVVPSGSGATHAGFLFGVRALGLDWPVTGVCVRRNADLQRPRLVARCEEIAELLGCDNPVKGDDIVLNDQLLPPGYGRINTQTHEAILKGARREALVLDPVYAGKTFAGFLEVATQANAGDTVVFLHTGGTPAVFAYELDLVPA